MLKFITKLLDRFATFNQPDSISFSVNTWHNHLIIVTIKGNYQSRFQGLANFYQFAHDRSRKLSKLQGVMEHSLVMTLANKHHTWLSNIHRKYSTRIHHNNGKTYKGLEVRVEGKGKEPLVATKPLLFP